MRQNLFEDEQIFEEIEGVLNMPEPVSNRGSSLSSATGARIWRPTWPAPRDIKYAPNARVVRVMCSGRVDPQFVLEAFAEGADGVLIGGCHPGDCHYQEGNYKALRRFVLLRRMLKQMGIEERAAAPRMDLGRRGRPGETVINEMVEKIRALGPLRLAAPVAEAELTEVPHDDKPKVAFYWCASCGGCEEAVLDLGEELLDVADEVDIVFWPVALDFKRDDRRGAAGRLDRGDLRQRRRAHFRAGRDGAPAAAEIAAGRRLRRLRAVGRHPRAGEPLEPGSDPATVYGSDRPLVVTRYDGHEVLLPEFQPRLRILEDVIDVDYFIPGCPPTPNIIRSALAALLGGELPERGTVLAPDQALCEECPRRESKPEQLSVESFKRHHRIVADEEHVPAGAGAALPGCGDARRLRSAMHSRQHAVHGLLRSHQPGARLRRQDAFVDRVHRGGTQRDEIERCLRRHSRPGRDVLSLQPGSVSAGGSRIDRRAG